MPRQWPWWVLWVLIVAGAAFIRTWQLGTQILVDDEWHALHQLMRFDYRQIFLSFGQADHTIPLTLFYKFVADHWGLSEWRMRAVPWLAGVAMVAVVPWALRPWLMRHEGVVLAVLLALSPMLIHFSRYARSHALVALLGLLAMVALWRWWHERDARWVVLFVPAAVICAWMQPMTLVMTASAMLWFVALSLKQLLLNRDVLPITRIMPVAITTLALASALLVPPLLADPWRANDPADMGSLQWSTLVHGWQLMVGTAHGGMALLGLGLAGIGAWVMSRRAPAFLIYWGYLLLVMLLALAWLNPAWVSHALVPVRHLSMVLPMVLMLMAVGLGALWRWGSAAIERRLVRRLSRRLSRRLAQSSWAGRLAAAVPLGLLLLAWVSTGPLYATYGERNQFSAHLRYHFDYNFERNPFARVVEAVDMPAIYQRMAAEPGDWVLIESPWHFESHFSPLSAFQRRHQQLVMIGVVSGLCAEWVWGEPVVQAQRGYRLRLSQFVRLADLPHRLDDRNRFVIVHRQPLTTAVEPRRALPAVEDCVLVLRETLGEPWHEEAERVVFRVPAGSAEVVAGR